MNNNEYSNLKNKLDGVGCGFCLAKWNQVTMHLQMGRTHSCHHPDTHIIPLSELKNNNSALHNTKYKKEQRRIMLNGGRPPECEYCWNIENNSNQFSDRIYKSSSEWALPDLEKIENSNWNNNINPRYVEVSFSNICNFKCSYCGPPFSSSWVKEMEEFGDYPVVGGYNGLNYLISEKRMPINNENNPYVDAFWKWWPELYRDLHTFRITGGEPLLSKDTWYILNFILNEKNPNKNLSLSINTNLGVPDKLVDKLINNINNIQNNEKVKDIIIHTSVDGWGEQAEYGRYGLIFNKFWDNVNKLLYRCPSVSIVIMSTYNVFSVHSYSKLINEIFKLKSEYISMKSEYISNDIKFNNPIILDSSYLRYPKHQSVKILTPDFYGNIKYQADVSKKLKNVFNEDNFGYSDQESDKIMRIYDWVVSPTDEKELLFNRKNFILFVDEHDKRRGTNFLKTFPEYEDFYSLCKKIKNKNND